MLKIFLLLCTMAFPGDRQFYLGQNMSLIDWEKNKPVKFLDIRAWKLERQNKEENPNWEILMKDRKLSENLGRALECIGVCRLYRGKANNKIKFKSLLIEGDEIVTEKDSYLWIFLLDGTLVRLSPKTSISLREINIGLDAIFFHVRVNFGNVLWLSRDIRNTKVENIPDTDSLFIPLSFTEANPEIEEKEYLEGKLFSLLEKSTVWQKSGIHLNRLIDENNLYIQGKPTYTFLILPNVTLTGYNLSTEVIVLDEGFSYFKKRDAAQLNLMPDEDGLGIDKKAEAYLRNSDEKEGLNIEPGIWYRVPEDGTNLEKADQKEIIQFWPSESLTQRITSIMTARELLFRKYSAFMFETQKDPQYFAQTYGYRLWERLEPVYNQDLYKRAQFLKEYTKREEKIIYLLKKKFYESNKDKSIEGAYNEEYFLRALNYNYMKREFNEDEFQKILLDSGQ